MSDLHISNNYGYWQVRYAGVLLGESGKDGAEIDALIEAERYAREMHQAAAKRLSEARQAEHPGMSETY